MPRTRVVALRRAGRTVLTYVKVEFVGDWEYYGAEYSYRPVDRTGGLLVVTEMPTGTLVTHWFVVRRRPDLPNGAVNTTDGVIVPREENIVFVPERCAKRVNGDATTCG